MRGGVDALMRRPGDPAPIVRRHQLGIEVLTNQKSARAHTIFKLNHTYYVSEDNATTPISV